MSPTVDDLRNEIRQAVGRFERIESTAFTKEDLAAICDAVNYDVDGDRLPSKSEMRAGILRKIDDSIEADPDDTDRAFRKADLESIARAVRDQ